MKKILFLLVVLALAISVVLPAVASASTVSTGVEVTQGGGNIPVIKCKWETPDDADPAHVLPCTQFAPSMVYAQYKELCIWVVVTDVEDSGNVAQVIADVYHPTGVPANGSIKFDNVQLTKVAKFAEGIPAFDQANLENLIAYNTQFNYAEVREELLQCRAEVWKACVWVSYHEPAGDHLTTVVAIDTQGNSSVPFSNTWNYWPTAGIEIDFTSVLYPPVMISKWVNVDGDADFTTAAKPTVRNIGNVPVFISVMQDDMGFGKYADGTWKVGYDARLGPAVNDSDPTHIYYDPTQVKQFPNALALCYTKKMDFSIHVKFATPGPHYGTMTITCTGANMTDAYPNSFPGPDNPNTWPSPMDPDPLSPYYNGTNS